MTLHDKLSDDRPRPQPRQVVRSVCKRDWNAHLVSARARLGLSRAPADDAVDLRDCVSVLLAELNRPSPYPMSPPLYRTIGVPGVTVRLDNTWSPQPINR